MAEAQLGGGKDSSEDVELLRSMGYAQELIRRMSGFSNFAISFSIISILAGGGGLVFVTAAVNVGAYSLIVNFVGPLLGIDPTQLGVVHQVIGVTLITASHALFNHLGIRVTTLLPDFSGYWIFFVAVLLTLVMVCSAFRRPPVMSIASVPPPAPLVVAQQPRPA